MTPELGLELMKLLLQVAFADLHLDDAEREGLRAMMDRLGLDDAGRAQIEAALGGAAKLPPPDLGALRAEKERVMRCVGEIAMADGVLHDDEGDLVREIAAMLA